MAAAADASRSPSITITSLTLFSDNPADSRSGPTNAAWRREMASIIGRNMRSSVAMSDKSSRWTDRASDNWEMAEHDITRRANDRGSDGHRPPCTREPTRSGGEQYSGTQGPTFKGYGIRS